MKDFVPCFPWGETKAISLRTGDWRGVVEREAWEWEGECLFQSTGVGFGSSFTKLL